MEIGYLWGKEEEVVVVVVVVLGGGKEEEKKRGYINGAVSKERLLGTRRGKKGKICGIRICELCGTF